MTCRAEALPAQLASLAAERPGALQANQAQRRSCQTSGCLETQTLPVQPDRSLITLRPHLQANESMRLSRQTSGLLRALDCFSQGIMLVDTSTSDWSIVFVNDAWVAVTGIQREKGLGGAMWQLCKPARAGDEVSPST